MHIRLVHVLILYKDIKNILHLELKFISYTNFTIVFKMYLLLDIKLISSISIIKFFERTLISFKNKILRVNRYYSQNLKTKLYYFNIDVNIVCMCIYTWREVICLYFYCLWKNCLRN